jgi:hypothetical protein
MFRLEPLCRQSRKDGAVRERVARAHDSPAPICYFQPLGEMSLAGYEGTAGFSTPFGVTGWNGFRAGVSEPL